MVGNQVRQRARVEVDLEPNLRVLGNESRLAQVFLNLLQNACDAMPEGDGNVMVVRGLSEGDTIRVEAR
jgi:C4-dicarboxylate-specific signal transduction histidine kinase